MHPDLSGKQYHVLAGLSEALHPEPWRTLGLFRDLCDDGLKPTKVTMHDLLAGWGRRKGLSCIGV